MFSRRRLKSVGLHFAAWLALAMEMHAAIHITIGNNFTGSTLFTDAFTVPPDSNGAIGPAHFIEFINGRFSVYDKTNATRVQSMTDVAFWKMRASF